MPRYRCTQPPATVTVKIGGDVQVFEFPDDQPVEVSDAAALLLADDDEDAFEAVA